MRDNIYTDGSYGRQHPGWHAEDSPWKAAQILKMLRRNDLEPASVCEAGCGAGEILSQLHEKLDDSTRFCGYEISPQAFELARPRRRDRLDFKLQDLLEDEPAHYDLVLAIDVVEHVEDYSSFLRVLQTKGTYKIFHIPLDLSVQTVFRGWPLLQMRGHLGHLHFFTKDLVLRTLGDLGYQVLDHFYTPSRLELSTPTLRAKLAKLPRRAAFKLCSDLAVRVLGGYSLMVLSR